MPRQLSDNIVRHFLEIQALRVAMGNHIEQMKRDDRTCSPTTEKVFAMLEDAEKLLEESELVGYIKTDSIAREVWETWAKDIRGVGQCILAQLMLIANRVPGRHVSSLWKFMGMHVEVEEDGTSHAPRFKAGQKGGHNPIGRMICFKLGDCLIKLNADGKYRRIYDESKLFYQNRANAEGLKIVPSATLKTKKDKSGYISEGHIHNRARRKMVKRFLSDLWVVWVEAMGHARFEELYGCKPAGPYAERLTEHPIIGPRE